MTLRKIYWFNHSNGNHPSFEEVAYLFLSWKWWQSSILWSVLCCFHPLYHCSHSLPPIVIRCHSLSLAVTCCTNRYHSLSLVVIRCHSLYHLFSLAVIRCHSLPLDVPLLCLFINDHENEHFKQTNIAIEISFMKEHVRNLNSKKLKISHIFYC